MSLPVSTVALPGNPSATVSAGVGDPVARSNRCSAPSSRDITHRSVPTTSRSIGEGSVWSCVSTANGANGSGAVWGVVVWVTDVADAVVTGAPVDTGLDVDGVDDPVVARRGPPSPPSSSSPPPRTTKPTTATAADGEHAATDEQGRAAARFVVLVIVGERRALDDRPEAAAGRAAARVPASRAAPRAVTSFGWASMRTGTSSCSATSWDTSGMRDDPPTRSAALRSALPTPARSIVRVTSSIVCWMLGRIIASNSGRVIRTVDV